MATTTKMLIPYPASSDLVKDGATNMGSMATQIDAKTGLVLLSTTSFSASSSVIRNDFSTSFSHYRVLFDIVMTGNNSPTLRLTNSSGTSVSSAGYYGYTSNYAGTAYSNYANSSSTTTIVVSVNQTYHSGSIEFFNPYSSTLQTRVIIDSAGDSALRNFGMGAQNTAAQNNGFEFFPNTGTITGTISVFGYNK